MLLSAPFVVCKPINMRNFNMIRTIDRSQSHLVQKVYGPKGNTIAYQVAPIGLVGDASLITRCSTLAEAREIAKSNPPPSVAQQEA